MRGSQGGKDGNSLGWKRSHENLVELLWKMAVKIKLWANVC